MNQKELEVFHALHPAGTAFDYQVNWCSDESKYKLAVKARQIGITTSEATKKFMDCLFWKECVKNPLPLVVVMCSPSQRQSSRLMEYIHRVRSRFERHFKTRVVTKKEREDLLKFDNGTEIWSLPNNPRTIEGIDASHGVIDEFGNFEGQDDKNVYESLMGSLGAKGGGMTMFGKPRGRRGLFWQFYDPFGEFSKNFSIHHFPYSVRARHDKIYEATVEGQRLRMTPLAWKEQYMCEFVDEGVVLLPWEMLDKCTNPNMTLWTLYNQVKCPNPVYAGIDFARRDNETIFTIVEDGEEKASVRFQEAMTDTFDVQIEKITKLINHFRPITTLVDETGMGLPILDQLVKIFGPRVEGMIFSQKSKEKMILQLRNLFEEGKIEIPEDKDLKDQLHGIEKTVLESGRTKYTGKRTETDWLDDRAWSLALACYKIGDGEWSMMVSQREEKKRTYSAAERFARDIEDE